MPWPATTNRDRRARAFESGASLIRPGYRKPHATRIAPAVPTARPMLVRAGAKPAPAWCGRYRFGAAGFVRD